jgi:hypothetical protein
MAEVGTMTDHTITIATKQAPIDTLEPPTLGTLYRWECSCGVAAQASRSNWELAWRAAGTHVHIAQVKAEGR